MVVFNCNHSQNGTGSKTCNATGKRHVRADCEESNQKMLLLHKNASQEKLRTNLSLFLFA